MAEALDDLSQLFDHVNLRLQLEMTNNNKNRLVAGRQRYIRTNFVYILQYSTDLRLLLTNGNKTELY